MSWYKHWHFTQRRIINWMTFLHNHVNKISQCLYINKQKIRVNWWGFSGGPVVKNPPWNVRDTGLILIWEDPICRRATKPIHQTTKPVLESPQPIITESIGCNYWSPSTWSLCSSTREATAMRNLHTATKSSLHSLQLEKSPHSKEDLAQPINK